MGIGKWLGGLVSGGVVETAKGVADVVDRFVETEDEKRAFKTVMARMAQEPGLAQVELNRVAAGHRSIFVAGWRPTIGYVCALGLGFAFIVNPILQWATGEPGPEMPTDIMLELVIGMLGLAGLRSVEKLAGRSK